MIIPSFISDMGIKKQFRLKSKKRIEELFRNGNTTFHYPLQLICAPSHKNHHRIAVIVGKKKIRRAHQRNLLKRRIREQCRILIDDFYTENPLDMLFIFQAREILDSAVIMKGLSEHLTEVGILK